MKITNIKEFMKHSMESLEEILAMLMNLPELSIQDLQGSRTALVIVDMVNGFVREGALKSPRVEALIPDIVELVQQCAKAKIKALAFADCHTKVSPEFEAYPVHCMAGTYEAEIVDEIKEIGEYLLIHKNSTNGFFEEEFQKWLKINDGIDTYVITGDCTDICVQQFAITLKTWFNKENRKIRVIVPVNAVETYDLGLHNGDLANVMALYNMINNGIEVVKSIK
ncbi:MAG: isochorismatase [Firmicutes bacterium]|nr:isochorismatase [Bacillota bacterium]